MATSMCKSTAGARTPLDQLMQDPRKARIISRSGVELELSNSTFSDILSLFWSMHSALCHINGLLIALTIYSNGSKGILFCLVVVFFMAHGEYFGQLSVHYAI